MLARTILWMMAALLLAGCKLELPVMGSTLSGPLQTETVEFQQAGGPKCPGTADVTPETIRCASLGITYPKVLAAGNPATVTVINQFIQAQLLEYSDPNGKQPASLDEFASMFINDYNAVPDNSGLWEMERRMGVSFSADHLATLNFSESGYTGGAHPFSGQRYFVLDVDSGKQLTLGNLLAAGYEEGLNAAGERAFRQERGLPADASLEEAGFWFANNMFKVNTNFGVAKNGLVFNFNPYEIAPYAMGPTEFTVPYADIAALIPADSLLAPLAK